MLFKKFVLLQKKKMRNIIYIICAIFFSSCMTLEPTVTYENTNASLIQESIRNLETVERLKSKINKNDKLAIIGLEDYNTSDYSLLATLEDEIIKDFVSNGYKIYERDNDMLYRLIAEESANYKYTNRVKKFERAAAYESSSNSLFGSSNDGYNNTYIRGNSSKSAGAASYSQKNYNQQYQSSLKSVDKIISYRVIESGIIYDYEEKDAGVNEVEREARTILEVRLTNAKTSEILDAVTLDGKANDFIDERDISALEHFSYKYYSHTLPKTHGNPKFSTVKKSSEKRPWLIFGTVFGLLLIIPILAG